MARSSESLIWKLEVKGVKLFTKLSSAEAQCNVCLNPDGNGQKKYKLSNRSPTVLIPHISKHDDYKKAWDKLQEQEQKKADAQKEQLLKFATKGRSFTQFTIVIYYLGIPSDDRKVINFIACTNQRLSVVEHATFKMLVSVSDLKGRTGFISLLIFQNLGRDYYTQTALPNVYDAVKKRVNNKNEFVKKVEQWIEEELQKIRNLNLKSWQLNNNQAAAKIRRLVRCSAFMRLGLARLESRSQPKAFVLHANCSSTRPNRASRSIKIR